MDFDTEVFLGAPIKVYRAAGRQSTMVPGSQAPSSLPPAVSASPTMEIVMRINLCNDINGLIN